MNLFSHFIDAVSIACEALWARKWRARPVASDKGTARPKAGEKPKTLPK